MFVHLYNFVNQRNSAEETTATNANPTALAWYPCMELEEERKVLPPLPTGVKFSATRESSWFEGFPLVPDAIGG
jgi:hypothetical protein